MLALVAELEHHKIMSEQMRDLSEYGISMRDQQEWEEVREGYGAIPPYPEALRDMTKPVIVLNMAEEYVNDIDKRVLRTLVGKIDGVFATGVITAEKMEKRKEFEVAFTQDAEFDGRTFLFGRTKVFHLPAEQYELTSEPTEWAWGRMRVQDTPPDDAVEQFDISHIDDDAEIIVIPPCQTSIDVYAQAVEDRFGKVPHIAFWTVTRFADNVTWQISEYGHGMPNLMGLEDGAL